MNASKEVDEIEGGLLRAQGQSSPSNLLEGEKMDGARCLDAR